MKKNLFFIEESLKTRKSIQNVLSFEEMMTIRGGTGGKVTDDGDEPN